MCGYVGVQRPAGRQVGVAEPALERMRDAMAHRGPDGVGLWFSPDRSVALAHRRLSIIDLSEAANQPMAIDDGRLVIAFNGEIYNHADLRREIDPDGRLDWQTDHSDTEVLLRAYQRWGIGCLDRLYGMFSFALWDARDPDRPVTHLVRDRMGVKPLYIARTDAGEWVYGSEIRALLAHPSLSAEMDLTAFWHYLTFIVAPAPLTLFRGVFKVPAGHRVEIDHTGRARAQRWYSVTPSAHAMLTTDDLSFEEAAEQLKGLLRTSIGRRMVADVPFGVLLSGGVDSSLNVALMSELMDRPVTTFTIGYEGHEETNEFRNARKVVERYGTDHHERRITSGEVMDFLPDLVRVQDEPIADNVCIPLYFISELVKQSGTTVVQVGEGADEHFLGYWWCEDYRRQQVDLYDPARRPARPSLWDRIRGNLPSQVASLTGLETRDQEVIKRALAGEELFWGGAACFWGGVRDAFTPDSGPFAQTVDCPVEDLLPKGVTTTDSHEVILDFVRDLGDLADPEVLSKIPYVESRLRLPEHLLMRVDKMSMAHSIEARVPFLDHEVVEFAWRLPYEYRLSDGIGKRVLKKVAEEFLDHDEIYRRKQGFGAPMDAWFADGDFGQRCMAAFDRSSISRSGLVDADWFRTTLGNQMTGHGGGYGFHLWTVLNAVLWHQVWVEGEDNPLA